MSAKPNLALLEPMARDVMLSMWQFFVKTPERLDSDNEDCDGFERSLYLVRLHFDVELRLRGLVCYESDSEVYVASFSSRIIVYKGMVQGCMVPQFYKDLTNPDFTVFNQRGTRLASSPSLKNLTS